jgi:hypothetical protein
VSKVPVAPVAPKIAIIMVRLLSIWDTLSSPLRRACEKTGTPNFIILFRLVNIPTFRPPSSQKLRISAVKNLDNLVPIEEIRTDLPSHSAWLARFSKSGQHRKPC